MPASHTQSQSWVMGGDRSSDVTVKLLQVGGGLCCGHGCNDEDGSAAFATPPLHSCFFVCCPALLLPHASPKTGAAAEPVAACAGAGGCLPPRHRPGSCRTAAAGAGGANHCQRGASHRVRPRPGRHVRLSTQHLLTCLLPAVALALAGCAECLRFWAPGTRQHVTAPASPADLFCLPHPAVLYLYLLSALLVRRRLRFSIDDTQAAAAAACLCKRAQARRLWGPAHRGSLQ